MTSKMIKEEIIGVINAESDSLKQLVSGLDYDTIERCVDLLCRCKENNGRVVTSGTGTSGAAAKKIAHTLSCVEIPSFFLSPADSVHGGFGVVQEGDVAVFISKGGETAEMIKMIPAIKSKGVKLIGVTEVSDSTLATQSDIHLKVKVEKEPDPFNMLATASTMAVIAVFDAIAIALMKITNYSKDAFLTIHPGGAVGKRLSVDVEECN